MSNYRIPRSLVHLTHKDMHSDIISRFEHVLLSEYSVGAHIAGEQLEQEFIIHLGMCLLRKIMLGVLIYKIKSL